MSKVIYLISVVFFYAKMLIISSLPAHAINANTKKTRLNKIQEEFICLGKQAPTINTKALKLALTAYQKASEDGDVKNPILTVIDFSLPSNQQRMWVFDLQKDRLLYNTYVAHGRNSGDDVPNRFSNQPSSKASSLGTYVTSSVYIGANGYSLNLEGIEPGFNDNAYSRRVVIHGAWYVEPDFIRKAGHAGRSWGCPAVANTVAKPLINTIKNGSVLFAYYPDNYYLSHSNYVTA